MDASTPRPAVVFAHDGGGVSCSVDVYAPQIARYIADTVITFFDVDDVFSSLKYNPSHVAEFNIDPERIAIMGDSVGVAERSPLEPFLIWNSGDNKQAWNAIPGDEAGKEDASVSVYAAPGRAKDLRDPPSTYIEVGGLDLFRAEDASYASRIAAEDVEVELHVRPGLPHIYEAASEVTIVKKALDARKRALKTL
ncbi:hypothetical protein N0V84_008949 [Fusarium piperis]|uniref:Alpha/beta hydrolase fold-3 domain-containing protein n=1 Tax=Fusarium piperis TaxID=1435070 RepID=A0A9W8W783_9HYPO|nr:hypothetical protein N0V84_008949 [Fusarium piperis]